VDGHRSGDRPHRAAAGAEALGGVERRPLQPRMGVEPEVVVARQRDDLAAVDDASALLLALDDAEPSVRALRLELLDLGVEEGERVAGACGRIGHGRSTTFPAWRDAM